MQIHLATLNDLSVIRNLAKETWPNAYSSIISNNQIEYMLDMFYADVPLRDQMLNKKHQFHLLKINSETIAFSSISKMNPDRFRLHKLYVLPTSQKRGLGKMLLQNIFNIMQQEGAIFLELNVNRKNNALQFYQNNGFSIVGEEDIDIGNGYFMNDYVMECRLADQSV